MKLGTYLSFDGRCKEAFTFYQSILGGTITTMMTFGESPLGADMPPAEKSLILHATLNVDGQEIAASDAPPSRYRKPQGFYVQMNLKDVAKTERFYKALAEGGQVEMELQKTFWADRFAMLVDRFGIPWMLNCNH